ncbi:hypothetical protein KDA_03180 [Dictyobacter alpinus]|uniref:Uncharacterized protein n=1 Tax=Dictyobacter alpinus TaxID=2014873 RepID=A0A402B0F7_9CHLR|nr:hypothetical protein KDA_03180 [Dictyobacter alpinus]
MSLFCCPGCSPATRAVGGEKPWAQPPDPPVKGLAAPCIPAFYQMSLASPCIPAFLSNESGFPLHPCHLIK